MKEEKDYLEDISNIRNMMERSSKFKSLSGISGILAGIYGLVGAYFSYFVYEFQPTAIQYTVNKKNQLVFLVLCMFVLAIGSALILAYRNSKRKKEQFWNLISKRLFFSISMPLLIGAILIAFFVQNNMIGLVAPFTLILYGQGIYNASKFSYSELGLMGLLNIVLGLISIFFIPYSILFWSIGFGALHVIFGIYIYYKYEIETIN